MRPAVLTLWLALTVVHLSMTVYSDVSCPAVNLGPPFRAVHAPKVL